jgi:hypothetical protein
MPVGRIANRVLSRSAQHRDELDVADETRELN